MIMILIPVVFHNECKFQQFQRVTSESTYHIRIVTPNSSPVRTHESVLHRYIYHPCSMHKKHIDSAIKIL